MARICALGAINVDVVYEVETLPRPGETCQASSCVEYPGGKGANQAVAMRRLCGEASLIGCVGDDARAVWLRGRLQAEGVDCRNVTTIAGEETAVATIAVDRTGSNFILVHPGSNAKMTVEDVLLAIEGQPDLSVISLHAEWPVPALEASIHQCHARGIRTVLNWTPTVPLSPDALASLDAVVINEIEAEDLTGKKVSSPEEAARAAEDIRRKGPAAVVVTLGAQGAVYVDETNRFSVAPPPVMAVDSTSAGDCFCASLAVGFLEGEPPVRNVSQAVLASAIAVTRRGAIPSLPSRSEIEMWCGNKPTFRLL